MTTENSGPMRALCQGLALPSPERPFGAGPHSPTPLSRPPPRPTGREGLKQLSPKGLSPSSPVRSGGRPGEEGRGDEGQRTGDAGGPASSLDGFELPWEPGAEQEREESRDSFQFHR